MVIQLFISVDKMLKFFRVIFTVSLLSIFVFLSGCTTMEEQKAQGEQDKGQFTLFLNGPDKAYKDITFSLLAVHIVSEEGISREVMSIPMNINSMKLESNQILLGETFLPEGSYKNLRFVIRGATIKSKEKTAKLALSTDSIEIPINIVTRKEQNTSIFINWNSDASVVDGYLFQMLTAVESQGSEISALLIYVTNEDSGNVSVINKHSGEVVATIKVGEKPRGIAATLKKEMSKVYVANSGSNSISVIDPTTNKVENEVFIKLGRKPEGIAAAAVSSEKDLIFVSNYSTNSISVIDSTSFLETEKIDVGQGPVAVAVDPIADVFTGARYLDFEDINIMRSYRESFFNVYVANRNSNNVSVIRMDKMTGRSEDVVNVNVGWSPSALTVDYKRGKVYVANYGSDKLSVIDIVQIIKGNNDDALSINNIGNYVNGVIADPSFDRIYLLKEIPGEIMVIRPFLDDLNTLQSTVPPIMGIIPVGDSPRSFVFGPENRKIYVVNRGANTISVVDKTTKKEEQVIHVGKKPYGIAIFQN